MQRNSIDRETESQGDRETQRHRDKETERQRQRGRKIETQENIETKRDLRRKLKSSICRWERFSVAKRV